MQSGRAGEKLLHGISAMNGPIVQENNQVAADLMQQMTKEYSHLFALKIVLIKLTVEGTPEAFRTDGDPRDGRDSIMSIPMNQQRRLAYGTPGFTNRGNQEEARFVDKDEMGRQPCGVFFTRGQTDRFHSAMAASLRSAARRSGF